MKKTKKIFAAVLTAVMIISMLPATAFATENVGNEEDESAVEAVTMSSEEQDVETTVENVGEETSEETMEEPSEAAPAEETVDPAAEEAEDVPEEDASEEDASEEAETEEETEAVQEEPVEAEDQIQLMNDPIGPGFPASFTYSGNTYYKEGDPVALNANFRLQGFGQTNWLNEHNLNGQIFKTGQIYYQIYKSGNRQIVVYEIPSLIEVAQGSGLYISPNSMYNSMVDVGRAPFESNASSYRVNPTGGAAVAKGVISNLEKGLVTYGFTINRLSQTQSGTIDVVYDIRSGSESQIKYTYTITYKDGLNGQLWNPDQIYKDQDAVEGNLTPHFKWPDSNGNYVNSDPERYGYRFAGWADENGTIVGDSNAVAGITITGDATYTAQWERVTVTVNKQIALDGVTSDDVDHTVYFALYDNTDGKYVTDGNSIIYKSISISDGVPSGSAVFGTAELIPAHNLSIREVKEPVTSGNPERLTAANSEFTNTDTGVTMNVSDITFNITDADGNVISAGDNNVNFIGAVNVSPCDKDAYASVVNTYSADLSTHKFTIFKKWVDYSGTPLTDDAAQNEGYTATISLYQKVNGLVSSEAYATKELDGAVDEIETVAWAATFSDLPFRDEQGNAIDYVAKETACTDGFDAYSDQYDITPMADDAYKVNGNTIWNKENYIVLVKEKLSDDGTSSTKTEERLPFGQYNLLDKVETGYLYGGYYHYENNTKGGAYTEDGSTFRTKADTQPGTKYLLKEVPFTYLRPQVNVISSKIYYKELENGKHAEQIRDLYGFVNVDAADTDYKECGLIANGTTMPSGGMYEDVTFTYGADSDSYTAQSLNGTKGYLGLVHLGKDFIVKDTPQWFTGYYVTKDNIKVTGTYSRRLIFASMGADVFNDEPVFSGWKNSGGNTSTGLKQITKTEVPQVQSGEGEADTNNSFARKFTVFIPDEVKEYTITKVYSSGEEKQVVEAGDYTGKIAYAEKAGYMFAGWFLDPEFTNPASFADVSGDMTVYAKYISSSDVSLALTRKSLKKNTVTFNATVSVKGQDELKNVGISLEYKGKGTEAELSTKSVKKTGSGKNIKYTTQFKGTAAVKGLSLIDSFTGTVTWVTPDGTEVAGQARECRYTLGIVTVR